MAMLAQARGRNWVEASTSQDTRADALVIHPVVTSMLMDLFYETLTENITRKRRIHFHQFMIEAHKRMHSFKALTHRPSSIVMGASFHVMSGGASASASGPANSRSSLGDHGEEVDPIPTVAMEFAQEATVLCFDEFQVRHKRVRARNNLAPICCLTASSHPKKNAHPRIHRR